MKRRSKSRSRPALQDHTEGDQAPVQLDTTLNRSSAIVSLMLFGVTLYSFGAETVASSQGSLKHLSTPERLYLLVFLGMLASVGDGVIWSLTERAFGWEFGAGGSTSLPSGWQAVLLSISMTFPLVFVPALFQLLSRTQIVPPPHYFAGFWMVVSAAAGHIVLYGSSVLGFRGLRNAIYPIRHRVSLSRALAMEAVYTIVHFASIVLVYQCLIHRSPPTLSIALNTAIGALMFFFGISSYILIKYPGSLNDRTWIQVRGVISGPILMTALIGAMLI